MNFLKLPLNLLLTISLLATSSAGQQKRRLPEKTPAKPPAAPAPAPAPATPAATFDTLLSASSYKIYGEVRGVGQLVKSGAVTDVLDPFLKLGGPDKEFVEIVNWLKHHADQLTTSRLLVAAWPTFKDVPNAVVAIEFASPEEATKFESQLNGILPTILPPVVPQSSPDPKEAQAKLSAGEKPGANEKPANEKPTEKPSTEKATPVPGYALQRSGALLIVSDKPVELKKLRPKGAKLLAEDANFRVAYNRFASDPVFLYIDLKTIEKEEEEQRKQYAEEQKKAEEARKATAEKTNAEKPEETPDTSTEFTVTETVKNTAPGQPTPEPSPAEPSPEQAKEQARAEMVNYAFSSLQYGLFNSPPDWPDAVAFGFSPDNESFDLRALMIDSPGETSDPVPISHGLKFAAPLAPTSPAILPADSELVLTMALDFPHIYQHMSTVPGLPMVVATTPNQQRAFLPDATTTPVTTLESALKINIRDELLPVLGSELAVVLPMSEFGFLGPPASVARAEEKDNAKDPKPAPRSPFLVVSVRDLEAAHRLVPKILEGFAGKAATSLAQTERRQDTELVSYGGEFGYAFIGNFFVLPTDVATVRHVVDSYLKGETLASDPHFRNSTRWQPRFIQGQVYVSPSLMEQFKDAGSNPRLRISDEARALIARLGADPQPITYSLSNDGMGTFHELHVPKSLIQLTVANIASGENPPETVKNERAAMTILWSISNEEREHKEKNPTSFVSLEELIASDKLKKTKMDETGYKFDLRLTAEGFEVTAVPVEYGKSGKMSFFMDQTGMIRGGDHSGAPASASDEPALYN